MISPYSHHFLATSLQQLMYSTWFLDGFVVNNRQPWYYAFTVQWKMSVGENSTYTSVNHWHIETEWNKPQIHKFFLLKCTKRNLSHQCGIQCDHKLTIMMKCSDNTQDVNYYLLQLYHHNNWIHRKVCQESMYDKKQTTTRKDVMWNYMQPVTVTRSDKTVLQ